MQGEKGVPVEQKVRKERRSGARKAGLATSSEAADIKERWLRQQGAVVVAKDLKVSLLVPPSSDTPSSTFRFPSLEPSPRGSSLQPSPRNVEGPFPTLPYSTYTPPAEHPASPTTRDLIRTMAKPFPSRPVTLRSVDHSRNQSMVDSLATHASSTDLDETRRLSYMFPLPPPRTSPPQPEPLPLPPFASFPAAGPLDSETTFVAPSGAFFPRTRRPERRPVSATEATPTARPWTPVDPRRPSSMPSASVVPDSSRRPSRTHIFDWIEASTALSSAPEGNAAGVAWRSASIPSRRGGQRSSGLLSPEGDQRRSGSLLLESDVPVQANAAGSARAHERASWSSRQSQASTASGSARGGDQRRLSRRLSKADAGFEGKERAEELPAGVLDAKMEALVRELGI